MKPSIVNRIKSNWTLKRLGKVAMTVAFTLVIAIFLLAMLGTVVQAAGLVDDTVNVANEYSRYPLENYQLDFYVDNSWGWLPWNWSDGIGKQVMYGLYAITNFIWTISLYVSNATGYLVQEAYSLDFISATADSIGKNMQTLAGVSANGFSTEGFCFMDMSDSEIADLLKLNRSTVYRHRTSGLALIKKFMEEFEE